MAGSIPCETLKNAARLMSHLAETGGATSHDPRRGSYLVTAGGGRLRLTATDGTTRLEWSMPGDGLDRDEFEECIDASRFDALATRLADGGRLQVERDGGLLLAQAGASPSRPNGGTTRIRLPARAGTAFPPRILDPGPDGPAEVSPRWTVPAASLARALAFVAPFIGSKNPNLSRSVATWTPEGELVGGSMLKTVRVGGLPPSLMPLSFRRRGARVIAIFLERIAGDVEVRVGGAYCSFTGVRDGHVLEVRGEPDAFPAQYLGLDELPAESWRIDRKALLSSLEILEVFLPTGGDDFEFRVRGEGDNSAMRISTPGTEATRSSDEFAICRIADHPPGRPGPPRSVPAGEIPEASFWMHGRSVRRVLNEMRAVSITCRFDPVRRRICLTEAPRPGEIARSVYLKISRVEDGQNRDRLASGPVRIATDEPDRQSPEVSGIEQSSQCGNG